MCELIKCLIYVLIWYFLGSNVVIGGGSAVNRISESRKAILTSCRATDQCVGLLNCTTYMNMVKTLKKPLNRNVVKFLRKLECGFHHGYPMVCCSTTEGPFSTSNAMTPSSANRKKSVQDHSQSTISSINQETSSSKFPINIILLHNMEKTKLSSSGSTTESSTRYSSVTKAPNKRNPTNKRKFMEMQWENAFAFPNLDYFDFFLPRILNKNKYKVN